MFVNENDMETKLHHHVCHCFHIPVFNKIVVSSKMPAIQHLVPTWSCFMLLQFFPSASSNFCKRIMKLFRFIFRSSLCYHMQTVVEKRERKCTKTNLFMNYLAVLPAQLNVSYNTEKLQKAQSLAVPRAVQLQSRCTHTN